MKNRILAFAVAALLAGGFSAQAQEATDSKPVLAANPSAASHGPLKIGYTSVYYILNIAPRAKEIESDLKARSAQLQKELERKMADFQEKYQGFQRGQNTMSETIKADKYNELKNLESSIQEFQKNAESEMQTKREELLSPEVEKITKAIKEVAVENGYTYVLNGDPAVMIYGADNLDVTDLVLKKLNITRPVPGADDKKDGSAAPSKPRPSNFNSGSKGGAPKKVGK
jgi:outer membrane protein